MTEAATRRSETIAHMRERVLGESLREVATELRMIDAVDFVSYIRFDKFAHLEQLVSSAVEMHFKPGTLQFGSAADVSLDWGHAPRISLDMEFNGRDVGVAFSLVLESAQAGVQINAITFRQPATAPDENTRALIAALAEARGDGREGEPPEPVVRRAFAH